MALFMDIHRIEGVTAEAAAQAHAADLHTEGRYGVDYQKYWVDEATGQVFCLVDAPSADAARAVHQEAHGLVADTIHPVVEGV